MDTAKAANLFVNYPDADMFDFINAPIGKGKPIERKLSPLVCSRFTQECLYWLPELTM
jgi:hydroxyacid-oxoacid transhydrogenase